jgi:hypothetical protein
MRLRYARLPKPPQHRRASPTDTPRPTNTDAEPHPEGADRPSPNDDFPQQQQNDRYRQIEHPGADMHAQANPIIGTRNLGPTDPLTCGKIIKSNVSAGQTHDRSGPPGARTQNLRIKSLRAAPRHSANRPSQVNR